MKILYIIFALLCFSNYNILAQKYPKSKKIEGRKYSKYSPKHLKKINWKDTYSGIINCANCQGIEMQLTLKNKNNYILSTKDKNSNTATYIQKGNFLWDNDIIFLENALIEMPYMFKVQAHQVKAIFLIFGELKGENWENYTLYKQEIVEIFEQKN